MWINPLGINNCKVHYENWTVLFRQETRIMACTYLNSHLLGASREYVLHGLDPGLDWASFWPSTPYVFHVATSHSESCCLSQMDRVSHLTPSLLSGWLLTNVQYITSALLFFFSSFFLHFFNLSWQAGWSRPFLSDTGPKWSTLTKGGVILDSELHVCGRLCTTGDWKIISIIH